MLFMVIERFKDRDPIPVYQRVLMECDDARLLQEWILNCQGLGMTFEIVPVVPSKDTREVVAPFLDSK